MRRPTPPSAFRGSGSSENDAPVDLLLEAAVTRAGERRALADAEVLLRNAVVLLPLCNVLGSLPAVLDLQCRSQIKLPMLTAIAESDNMIALPLITRPDLAT